MAGVTRLIIEGKVHVWVVITGRAGLTGMKQSLKARILLTEGPAKEVINTRMEHFYLKPDDEMIYIAWDADQ